MEAFQLRLWDGRIGRWLSPDPYGQYASHYLGMGNNPIGMIDPDGGSTEDCCPEGLPKDYKPSPGFPGNDNPIELNEILVRGTPKTNYVSSGAYGWNDGSAESFWRDYAPISSSLHTFFNGIINRDIGQAAWGAALIGLDAFSFGEGSLGVCLVLKKVYRFTLNPKIDLQLIFSPVIGLQ